MKDLRQLEKDNPWRALGVVCGILVLLIAILFGLGLCTDKNSHPLFPYPPPIQQQRKHTKTVICPWCGATYETGNE